MATWNGLEPSTSSVTGWHSNQLNYQAIIFLVYGGGYRARTCDPLLVRQMLSQLSYTPEYGAQTRNRTKDTGIFSPLLYLLSYLGKHLVQCTYKKMVGVAGFEPAAHWSQTSCATKLRYTPISKV